jgi:hypothetical protein
MLWIASISVATGVLALVLLVTVKREPSLGKLGVVSTRWIAEHRVDGS